MKKILEFKNQDWMKGNSLYPNIAIGGLFQVLLNCDPFDPANGGLAQPSLTPDSQSLATTAKFLTSFNTGGSDYIYVQSATKIYKVLKDPPYTVSDVTPTTTDYVLGKIVYKNCYIYAYNRSNAFKIHAAAIADLSGDTDITPAGYGQNTGLDSTPFCVGADNNLYVGDYQSLRIITNVGGTSSNGSAGNIELGFTVRDLINDGRYLVIFADNNTPSTASRRVGKYRCKVYFWDMITKDANSFITPDVVWDFEDSYIIGGQLTDKGIEFFGYNGLYVTNIATKPQLIRPFNNANLARMGRPMNPYQVIYSKGSLYWIDGSTNTYYYIYAYGNPITGQKKAFYTPYQTSINGISQTLIASGDNFILANDNPALFFFNVGSTRGTVQMTSLDTNMLQPHAYGFTKIVLGQKLATGQQVQVVAYGNGGQDVISTEIKTFTQVGAKQTLKFDRKPTTNSSDKFEDIVISVTSGAPLQRVSTYATPNDDSNVDL